MITALHLACASAALALSCVPAHADLVPGQLNSDELLNSIGGSHLPEGCGDFFFVLYDEQGRTLYNGNDDGNAGRMRFTGMSKNLLANCTGDIHGMAWGAETA